MPGKKGFGDSRKKSPDTPIYKMKGNPMQRNFPGWLQKKADMIQGTIHEIAGKVAKGFKGTDTERVVKEIRSRDWTPRSAKGGTRAIRERAKKFQRR